MQDIDNTDIPAAIPKPLLKQLDTLDDANVFAFDLETTSLGHMANITQIGLVGATQEFSTYVKPSVPIQPIAEIVSGISFDMDTGQMFADGKEVDPLSVKDALIQLIRFLPTKSILIAHNGKNFDSCVLLNALMSVDAVNEFKTKVVGFVDSLPMCKHLFPKLPTHKQQVVFHHLFSDDYKAHDALCDAKALWAIYNSPIVQQCNVLQFSFTVDYIHEMMVQERRTMDIMPSWDMAVNQGSVSRQMAKKAAASGLSFDHLCKVFHLNGKEGVRMVMSETTSCGVVRVTKHAKCVEKLCDYLNRKTLINRKKLSVVN